MSISSKYKLHDGLKMYSKIVVKTFTKYVILII